MRRGTKKKNKKKNLARHCSLEENAHKRVRAEEEDLEEARKAQSPSTEVSPYAVLTDPVLGRACYMGMQQEPQ